MSEKVFVAKESTSQEILAELRGQVPKRYGFRVKESESDPAARVEYLYDAVGLTPAHMNYSGNAFDYGSMADLWFVRDNKPYMVKSDGSVDYQLDPNDYTKKAVGGAASDVANTSYDGNAMSGIPTVWVKRWHENGYRYVVFCETQYDEGYKAYAHTRPDGTIAPLAFGPMFEGSNVSSKLRSLSGQHPFSGQNANTELSYAQANGSDWTILTWAFWQLMMDLLTFLGKSCDHQGVFGQGHSTGGSSATDLHDTGVLNDKGQFYGYNTTTGDVKVFHMENVLWGDRWERIVGLLQDHGVYKVKMTPEDGGYNFTGAGFESIMRTVASGGWMKKGQETEWGLFPTDAGGTEGYYDACYHYINTGVLSVPFVGGFCAYGSDCGRYLAVDAAVSHTAWTFGASLFLQNPS